MKEYTVEVPEGASRLDVSIGNTSDLGADLDLYVSWTRPGWSASTPMVTRRSR